MRWKNLLPLLLVALALVVTTGCSRKQLAPSHSVRVAVLDAALADDLVETRSAVTGWWLNTRDRWDSGNAGVQVGEALAREFARMPGVEVHSRTDLAAFMAQKEHALRRAFPDLEAGERRLLLQEQSPVDFGKSLNVDYVLASRVHQSRTTHNRTFNWWVSRVHYDVALWRVDSGEVVWSTTARDSRLFDSQVKLTERLARSVRKRAVKADAFGLYP